MRRAVILLWLCLFALPAFAQEGDLATSSPGAGDGVGEAPDDTGIGSADFEPDYFTGAATYRINIEVPPGRAGMTPAISFVYNSHDRDNDHGLGAGWEINESYIQRSLVRGTANYQGNDFILHEDGQNRQLIYGGIVQNNCSQYRFKVEDPNLRYFYKCEDHWEVVDKSGKVAIYGGPDAVQNSGASEYPFRWYLASITDLHGNRIAYHYLFQRYGSVTSYYISRIHYTSHANSPAAFTVEFNYDGDDSHVYPGYRAGFSSRRPPHISNIVILSGGARIKRYDFGYLEDRGVDLLQSVQLTAGEGAEAIVWPAKTFSYATFGEQLWRRHVVWNDPIGGVFGDSSYSIRDMNGDGLPDRVYVGPESQTIDIGYNTGSGFAEVNHWPDVCDGGCRDNPNQPFRQYLMDMNGDGLADRVLGGRMRVNGANFSGFYVRYNDGNSFPWAETWNDPLCADENSPKCGVLQAMDFNGDGLPDRYDINENDDAISVYYNRGHRFERMVDVRPNTSGRRLSQLSRFIDMNGDGLPDRVDYSERASLGTFANVSSNTGFGGFGSMNPWSFPREIFDFPKTILDMNSDGLPDLVAADALNGRYHIYFNSGRSFTDFDPVIVDDPVQDANFRGQLGIERDGIIEPAFRDFNGDGFLDRVAPISDDQYNVYLIDFSVGEGLHRPLHALASIDNGMGVVTNLYYMPSSELRNRFLPFNQYVLSRIVVNEGNEQKATDIAYFGGQFATSWSNVFGRKFNGYQFVQITDSLGNIEQRWYHQAEDVMGRNNLFIVDEGIGADGRLNIRDWPAGAEGVQWNGVRVWGDIFLSGKMFQRVMYIKKPDAEGWVKSRKELFDWDISYNRREGEARRAFVRLSRKDAIDYEGFVGGRTKATAYEYDTNSGNLLRQRDLGEVAQGEAERVAEFSDYATFNTPLGEFVSSQPSEVTKRENDNVRNHTQFTYDAALNLTRRDDDLITQGAGEVLTTSFAYDGFGNVTQKTDPRGTVTAIVYDAATQTYPERTTIANRFTTSTSFDVRFGKLASKTTPDGRTEARTYDALGRLLQKSFEARWNERYEYIDKLPRRDDVRFLSVAKKFTNIASDPDSNVSPRQVIFKDGQGRIAQTSARSERANTYRIKQTRYIQTRDRNEVYSSEPEFAAGFDFEAGMGPRLEVKTTLDSIGRTFEILPPPGDRTSPTGPTRFAYGYNDDPWVKTTTDAEGKIKREYFNVWGKVVQVSELSGNQEITTRYAYDFWNQLTLITDSAGNRTEFAYDNLGRKISSTNPNTGAKTFAYDEVGNIVQQIDAADNRIEWDYDEINRVTVSRSFNGQAHVDTYRYRYDDALDFAGRNDRASYNVRLGELFMVEDASGWTKFGYDQFGHVNASSRFITSLGQELHASSTNDPDGRVLHAIYPKGNVAIDYAYDTAGQVRELRESTRNELIYSINPAEDYDRFGHLLHENYGDGTRDDHVYYASSHRLMKNFVVAEALGRNYRAFIYGYDRVGNLAYLRDIPDLEGQNAHLINIAYDDLHRIKSYETDNDWESQDRIDYSYDDRGNITQNTESFRNDAYRYNAANRLTAIGADQIAYDNNGNITQGRGRGYAYNARNQLSQVTMQNGWDVRYQYDYTGQRIAKDVAKGDGHSNTYFLGNMLEVRDGQLIHNIFAGKKLIATIARGRINGPNGPAIAAGGVARPGRENPLTPIAVAIVLTVLLSRGQSPLKGTVPFFPAFAEVFAPCYMGGYSRRMRIATLAFTLLIFLPATSHAYAFRPDVDDNWPARSADYFFYVHADYLGSSNILTEGEARATHGGFRFVKGELVQRIEYTPFGKERLVLNSSLEELPKYTGQTQDIEVDLYYYGSRYYDPVLGRFIQPDSIIPDAYSSQSLNPYAYVLNNPLRYTDPTGHFAETEDKYEKYGEPTRESLDDGSGTSDSESGTVTSNSSITNWGKILDTTQLGLDVAGLIPGIGDIIDLTNAGISLARGNYIDAGFSAFAAIPFIGITGGVGKTTKDITKLSDVAEEAVKIITKDNTEIGGFTKHGIDRVIGDGGKRAGTKPEAIFDAIKNPTIIKEGIDSQGRPFKVYQGENARVVVNPETGKVISTNPLSGAGAN